MREVILSIESWKTKQPFRITGLTFTETRVLLVEIRQDGFIGRGEATGVYYLGETSESMLAQAESVRVELKRGAGREQLRKLLPAGGARNAIDCALWDLEAKRTGKRIWALTGIKPKKIITLNTVGIGTIEEMVEAARGADSSIIKVKLDADEPLERLTAIRAARPDAVIVLDVNQGWNFEQLRAFAPEFAALGVAMIEQPLPRGGDEVLEHYRSPVPLCADESCLTTGELACASRRYQIINIKLDKTGGLTEALDLMRMARQAGLELMVGNMTGTSLAMAPASVIAHCCRFVDLDGALLLQQDRENGMSYAGGVVSVPDPAFWG